MTNSTLLDLPSEIIQMIFYALQGPTLDVNGSTERFSQQHCSRLCLVCRRLYDLLNPLLWKEITIDRPRRLIRFARELNQVSRHAHLVRDFILRCHIEQFSYESLYWTSRGVRKYVDNLLGDILNRLTNLQRLEAYCSAAKARRLSPWLSGEYQYKKLQVLRISGFRCDLDILNNFFTFPNLQKLSLIDCDLGIGWEPTVEDFANRSPTRRTNAKTLVLAGEHAEFYSPYAPRSPAIINGISTGTIRIILSRFEALENLTIDIQKHGNDGYELDIMLEHLHQRCKIKSLAIWAADVLRTRLETEFSTWLSLEQLQLQSEMLWPLRDSWMEREKLYGRLPKSLKSLRIHFPSRLNEYYGVEEYDGIVQMNKEVTEYNFQQYHDQFIPQHRYKWILNLLGNHIQDYDISRPYLPYLQTIGLYEDRQLGGPKFWQIPREPQPVALPPEITEQFMSRGVAYDVYARVYRDPRS